MHISLNVLKNFWTIISKALKEAVAVCLNTLRRQPFADWLKPHIMSHSKAANPAGIWTAYLLNAVEYH
jgi:hypothetical protein